MSEYNGQVLLIPVNGSGKSCVYDSVTALAEKAGKHRSSIYSSIKQGCKVGLFGEKWYVDYLYTGE